MAKSKLISSSPRKVCKINNDVQYFHQFLPSITFHNVFRILWNTKKYYGILLQNTEDFTTYVCINV